MRRTRSGTPGRPSARAAAPPTPARLDSLRREWFYCLRCHRVWSMAAWRLADWACPSTIAGGTPEFHPHVRWSLLSASVSGRPAEGAFLPFAFDAYQQTPSSQLADD